MHSLFAYLRTTPWPLLAMAAALGICDFAILPLMSKIPNDQDPAAIIVFGCCGLIVAQFALLSIWWAWSRGEVIWRTLMLFGLAAALHSLWILGFSLSNLFGLDWRVYWDGAIMLALCWTCVALPAWLLRKTCGWGILDRDFHDRQVFHRQIAIRDIMAATVVAAVFASLARRFSVEHSIEIYPLLLMLGIIVGAAYLLVLPLTYWLLRLSFSNSGWIWSIIYSGMVSLLYGSVPFFISNNNNAKWEGVGFICMIYACCSCLILSLIACRLAGFHLVTAWDKPRVE